MKNILQIGLLIAALAGVASAVTPPAAPEISAGSAVSAVGLLAGMLLVVRSRRK